MQSTWDQHCPPEKEGNGVEENLRWCFPAPTPGGDISLPEFSYFLEWSEGTSREMLSRETSGWRGLRAACTVIDGIYSKPSLIKGLSEISLLLSTDSSSWHRGAQPTPAKPRDMTSQLQKVLSPTSKPKIRLESELSCRISKICSNFRILTSLSLNLREVKRRKK